MSEQEEGKEVRARISQGGYINIPYSLQSYHKKLQFRIIEIGVSFSSSPRELKAKTQPPSSPPQSASQNHLQGTYP